MRGIEALYVRPLSGTVLAQGLPARPRAVRSLGGEEFQLRSLHAEVQAGGPPQVSPRNARRPARLQVRRLREGVQHDECSAYPHEATQWSHVQVSPLPKGLGDVADGDSGKHCVCSHCGKGFGKSSQLLCHARTHHSGELPFACGDCGRRYVKASDLTQHAKSHSAVKPHRCVQCGKGFTKSSHLKRHCITHTDERPYSCAVCRKGFVESSDLNRHMAVHTGTDEGVGAVEYAAQEGRREYVCHLCGKGFSFRSNLVAHVRTHSGSKPFVCEHCGRGFAQSGNLCTHLRVHTGERPFACGVCHKRFSQKSTLNHHAKTH
ncbi:zinc finger protein 239-like [Ischnura elegans]|uniref:zinc finger protein 239-like n=1 Tax=Ischnura elegans TaxID=197161 RepID=UPI001ED87CA4|nr:zinc finger protein 239-like [Ischnura elegans]